MRFRAIFAVAALLLAAPVFAQMTVTLTPSVTAGDGTLVTDISWSTNPALPTGTPCVAGSTPTNAMWTGAKAGSGSVTGLVFTQNTRITLSCTFPGDSLVTFQWVNPTQNTDNTPYTNPKLVRLKYTFNPSITSSPTTDATGELHVDVNQTPTPATMRTVTGITQTGTMRAVAFAQNANDAWSSASGVATKVFQGNVTVNQGVDLTIRSIPNTVSGLELQ